MRTVLIVAILFLAPGLVSAQGLQIEKSSDSLRVMLKDRLLTEYRFNPDQKYPYFFPVNGPVTGRSLTTESSEPWPHHHSLFFGCDRVNGWNFWQEANERGQIVSQGPTAKRVSEAGANAVEIRDVCDWRAPGEPVVITDYRRMIVAPAGASAWRIDFHIRLMPQVDVTIQKSNHALFSARMAPHMNVENGGTLVNAEGDKGEKGTFGKKSPWCDYSGKNGEQTEGLAIFDHPANRWFPCTWFTRDYGFFSPTPMNWLPGGELKLPTGQPLDLHYRVIVHAGDATEAAIGERFAAWAKTEVGDVLEGLGDR
jgi:hypothetical protein